MDARQGWSRNPARLKSFGISEHSRQILNREKMTQSSFAYIKYCHNSLAINFKASFFCAGPSAGPYLSLPPFSTSSRSGPAGTDRGLQMDVIHPPCQQLSVCPQIYTHIHTQYKKKFWFINSINYAAEQPSSHNLEQKEGEQQRVHELLSTWLEHTTDWTGADAALW